MTVSKGGLIITRERKGEGGRGREGERERKGEGERGRGMEREGEI